ncbi:MAG: PaaI family thioesterase [Rhizobiales bacterium]|nr:PaaI family thioesterase [Hyphomicrobiales bacterium]
MSGFLYKGEIEFSVQSVNEESASATMPVKPGIHNPFGTVHAGAILWFADVTATVLAMGKMDAAEAEPGFPLAINLSANLIGNVTTGELRANARFVKKGRRVTTIRTEVTDQTGRLLVDVTTTHIPSA